MEYSENKFPILKNIQDNGELIFQVFLCIHKEGISLIDKTNLFYYIGKYFICFNVLLFFILFQTQCVPPLNDDIVNRTKTLQQSSKKGLNYQSMIKTFNVRLRNRFQADQDANEKSNLPDIYMTSASIHHHELSPLNQMIINDLKQSLEKDGFIVQTPTVISNTKNITPSECETRLAALDQKIKIILSSKACDLEAVCMLIMLDISYQGKTTSETCHLVLTPDLVQKKNELYQIPIQLGHLKKPFKNIDQSYTYIAKTLQCMFHALLQTQESYRLLFAKTDNTPKAFVDKLIKQWRNMTRNDHIAKTIIPIDCYGDQFVIRDAKISASIPDDILMLIAMDSIEIHPGKYRIRVQALSLKKQLIVSLQNIPSVPFGKCVPGCRFHLYTYTRSKGKSLIGEGSGECNTDMPKHLWSYSAKTLAENSARQALFNKVKHHMRKHYIANDLPYYENILDKKTDTIMNNALIEWENFDDKACHAEARYIIYDSFLPFALSQEPQAITKQMASLSIPNNASDQKDLTPTTEPQSMTSQMTPLNIPNHVSIQKDLTPTTEPQSITSQSILLVQSFNQTVRDKLLKDKISQPVIQLIETVGTVKCTACIPDNQLDSKQMRCIYDYDLTFVSKNKKICVCKGTINGVGNSVESAHKDCISALIDLFYPFPLDIALALNNKLSQEDLKQMLVNLDTKYFQLLEKIDTILEFIRESETIE